MRGVFVILREVLYANKVHGQDDLAASSLMSFISRTRAGYPFKTAPIISCKSYREIFEWFEVFSQSDEPGLLQGWYFITVCLSTEAD